MTKNTKLIIGLLVFAIIAGVAYYVVFLRDEPAVTTGQITPEIGQDLIATLERLESVQLDTEFFNRDTYQVLIDNTLSVESRPVGRINPFLPAENVNIDVVPNREKVNQVSLRQFEDESVEDQSIDSDSIE